MKATLIALMVLGLGCASSIKGYGVEYVAVIGNGCYHCDKDGSGPDSLSGGEISENAAGVLEAAAEGKDE